MAEKVKPNLPPAPAVAVPSSAPGTAAPVAAKPEKEKKVLPFHPALTPTGVLGNDDYKATTKIESLEALKDFNPKTHRGIGRGQFKSEEMYCEWRAQRAEKEAADWRQEAQELKKTGGREIKKIQALQGRIDDLISDLAGKGVDKAQLDALLAKFMAGKTETAKA